MEQLDAVLKETFVLLNREVDLYRYSPGFPEFTFTILQRLRKVSGEKMLTIEIEIICLPVFSTCSPHSLYTFHTV